jgi:hypothetical protein
MDWHCVVATSQASPDPAQRGYGQRQPRRPLPGCMCNEWLHSLGAADLVNDVSIDLAIVDELDDGTRQDKGKLFILFETSDGCGFLCVGNVLRLLEEHAGLGRSFYIVLTTVMNRWMEIYDISRAEYFYGRWKESIEMDIEDWDGSEVAFQEYCQNNDIHIPDLVAATPPCIREINFHKELKRLPQHVHMLRQYRAGKYGEWIERVLAIARFLKPEPPADDREVDGIWDDGPLPNWAAARTFAFSASVPDCETRDRAFFACTSFSFGYFRLSGSAKDLAGSAFRAAPESFAICHLVPE